MEQLRFHRLLEFEKKRAIQQQQRDREQLAMEAAAIALAEIGKQRIFDNYRNRRSKSKSRDRSRTKSLERYYDDYESSTAASSSSRDADFDEIDIDFKESQNYDITIASTIDDPVVDSISIEQINENIVNGSVAESLENTKTTETIDSFQLDEPKIKPSFFSRFFFTKSKETSTIHSNQSYLHITVDDGGPVSIKRILLHEVPLVWQQVVELHPIEWRRILLLRNRCIANFVILSMLFGFGGLVFRFIEGTFENFYKCGVRRVKRDFVDHLWSSSRDLRFDAMFIEFDKCKDSSLFLISIYAVKMIGNPLHVVNYVRSKKNYILHMKLVSHHTVE